MSHSPHEALLTEFCRVTGISDVETVLRTHHIEVNGRTIGLMPDPASREHINVYIDLGPVYPARDPHLQALVLDANLEPRAALPGAFGIDASTGAAAYRFGFHVDGGAHELARFIAEALEHAQSRFEAIKSIATA